MINLNEVEEETIYIIINNLKDNSNSVTLEYEIFPNYIFQQIKDIFYKLKISGYISSGNCWINECSVTLTPLGLSYFEKKGMRKELFEELPDNAKKLLTKLVNSESLGEEISIILNDELEKDETEKIIRGIIGTLTYNGLLNVFWADDKVYNAELTNAGRTYFEREKKYMEEREKKNRPYVTIENITNSGVFNMGNITDSNITITNCMEQIHQQIEEKGGEDKQELYDILTEVKDYIDNMKETKIVSKNTGLFKRIGEHFEKHQWFYSEILGLLGKAILSGMGNQL